MGQSPLLVAVVTTILCGFSCEPLGSSQATGQSVQASASAARNPTFFGEQIVSPSETRPPPIQQVSPPTAEKLSVTVYITRTGKKYHRLGCQYLRSSCIPVSLSTARLYYTPCSVCRPPEAVPERHQTSSPADPKD
jgi:hypothetical protein